MIRSCSPFQAGVHHRIGGHLAGPPHRPSPWGIGAQHQAVGSAPAASSCSPCGTFGWSCRQGHRHDQQRCAAACCGPWPALGGVRLAARQGAGVEVAQGPAAFAFYQYDEAPGPLWSGARKATRNSRSSCSGEGADRSGGRGNASEQGVESLHGRTPVRNEIAIVDAIARPTPAQGDPSRRQVRLQRRGQRCRP